MQLPHAQERSIQVLKQQTHSALTLQMKGHWAQRGMMQPVPATASTCWKLQAALHSLGHSGLAQDSRLWRLAGQV